MSMVLFGFVCGAVCVGVSALLALGIGMLAVRWTRFAPAQEVLCRLAEQDGEKTKDEGGTDGDAENHEINRQWMNLFAYDGKPQKKDGDEI